MSAQILILACFTQCSVRNRDKCPSDPPTTKELSHAPVRAALPILILAFKICLLKILTGLIKPPSNFGVAAAPNNQILRTCEASPGFAQPQSQTEFLLNLISHCWRCLWSQVNEQVESFYSGADPIGNPPCRHPFSIAFLLYVAVFTQSFHRRIHLGLT